LESVVVKDLYRAPNLPKEEYNLTLTFTYRAKDRTLTEDEAKGVHQKVLHAMMR
jgi:phenylalanyl-tRNA synthetase beta subunit